MKLEGKRVGFVITGAFGRIRKVIEQLNKIVTENKAEVIPVMSYAAYSLDTKFGKAKDFISQIEKITRERNNSYNANCRGVRS